MLGSLLNRFISLFENPVPTLISIFVLLFSLSIHEYAHGWVAYKLGDSTAKDAGRLTLNPLAHLDPIGTLMMLTGLIGWAKPVPVNPLRFDRKHTMKKGMMLTALAGPVSNLILSALAFFFLNLYILILVWTGVFYFNPELGIMFEPRFFDSYGPLNLIYLFLWIFAYRNIFLAIFNMLPVPPLDGFKVIGAALPNRTYYRVISYERYIGIAFIVLVFTFRSELSTVLNTLATPFVFIFDRPWRELALWILSR